VQRAPDITTPAGAGAASPRAASPAPEPTAAKRAIGLGCAAALALTLAPVTENWKQAPADDFPLSYYPMFSQPVGETYRVTHVVGLDRDGREHVIPYRYLGKAGLNEVRLSVRRAARREPQRFCERVAAELAADASPELRSVRQLVLRTGVYALEPFYAGRIEARSIEEHARCRVPR
jgi:hypothetical protein